MPPLASERRDWSRVGAGGAPFEGAWGIVVARNVTSSKEYGIGGWTDEQIIRALTQGISADGHRLAPPNERAAVHLASIDRARPEQPCRVSKIAGATGIEPTSDGDQPNPFSSRQTR
jgi:hypothetical protein